MPEPPIPSTAPYPIFDLDKWTRGEAEPGGDEEKRWFHPPSDHDLISRWLFKPRTVKELKRSKAAIKSGDIPKMHVGGEDWAEKVAFETARLLHMPAAETQLATVTRLTTGARVQGSMSRDMRSDNWTWSAGAALLSELDPIGFDADSCDGHTLEAIHSVLNGLHPADLAFRVWPAFDMFAGYLMLDALIANTDRHAHNWGILTSPDGTQFLGPTFDHGTAFGSGLGETKIAQIVREDRTADWCRNGLTKRFDGGSRIDLVELASTALLLASQPAREYWTQRIESLELAHCASIIASCSKMSEPTRIFVHTVLETNRRRLIDVLH